MPIQPPITTCTTCDGQTFKALVEAGKTWLESHYQRVNQLNVFPVPDGDTGTNMLLTIRNAYKEIADDPSSSVGVIAKRLAHGAIMGSRGNSGTIFSQICAGLAQTLGEADTFDVTLLATALQHAAEKAYQGVQKPVEGTILTVIREIAEEAQAIQADTPNLVAFLEQLVVRGWDAVERTPEMLPTLRQANVVDSGGTGLMYIAEGMLKYLHGENLILQNIEADFEAAVAALADEEADLGALEAGNYNYDVQFVLRGTNLPVMQIKQTIEAMGDSGVIIGTDTLVKVHIHVDDPGVPISYAVKLGILEDVVVENMQQQYEALLRQQQAQMESALPFRAVTPDEIAVIAVASGQGLAQVLVELGVAGLVDGGQTNNPSTAEILQAAQKIGAKRVIILPNNKNIFLAAQQAAQHATGLEVVVVPTRSVVQGIAAMMAYQATGELSKVAEEMQSAAEEILTIEITTAVRSVELNGVPVQEGQFIGIVDQTLRAAGDSPLAVLREALTKVAIEDYELLTLYYGAEITPAQAKELGQTLQTEFETLAIETVAGGQPHYPYIVSVE